MKRKMNSEWDVVYRDIKAELAKWRLVSLDLALTDSSECCHLHAIDHCLDMEEAMESLRA